MVLLQTDVISVLLCLFQRAKMFACLTQLTIEESHWALFLQITRLNGSWSVSW